MSLRLLVSSTADYPFIRDDHDLLRDVFIVDRYIGSGLAALRENYRRAAACDVAISWFGSVYSAAMVLGARRHGKGSIVILGGVDTAREPAMKYGIWRSRWKGWLLGWALRNADRVFAVDESLRRTLEISSRQRWPSIEILPTGYDSDAWQPSPQKERSLLCVANCDSMQRVEIKGIDLLLDAVRQFPDLPCNVIGITPTLTEELRPITPPNVTLLPPMPREALREHYGRALLYCQPSRREGLPNTLCEAMLSGCIPVGSDVGGIPEAIGVTGFVYSSGEGSDVVAGLISAIDKALHAPEELGSLARERIATHYSRTERRRRLVATIQEIADAHALA